MSAWVVAAVVGALGLAALGWVLVRRHRHRWSRRAATLRELAGDRITLDVVIEPHGRQVEVPLDCYLDEVRGEGADAVLLLTAPAAADRVPGLGRIPRELAITRVAGLRTTGGRIRW